MRRLFLLSILLLCSACKTTGTPPPGSLCAALHPAALTPLPEEACPASRDYPFTNLVFEGGGVKGVAYGGALEVLERQGILSRIERVAGTSAGSIAALLVALRYSPQEIRSELMHLDFKQFEDDGGLPGVFRIFNRYGYFKGDFALDWLRCRVAAKAGNPRATFRELHEKGFRELTVVVTDLSRRKSVLLSYATTPDMEVALAARMSMSIPFFFASVRGEGNAVFVDGGVFMNYPLSIYDGDEPNPRSLGFVLANTSAPPVHVEINDLGQYSKSLFEALLHVQDDLLANDGPAMVRTATLDDLGIPTTHFELTEAQKLQLMQQGAVGACAWLRDWRPEALEEAVRAQRTATPAR